MKRFAVISKHDIEDKLKVEPEEVFETLEEVAQYFRENRLDHLGHAIVPIEVQES